MRRISLSLAAVILAATGCGPAPVDPPDPDPTPTDTTPAATLALARSLTTLEPGESREIRVNARTSEYQPADFVVSNSEDDCVTVTPSIGSIIVKASEEPCSSKATLSVDALALQGAVTVNVIDPMTMDIGEGLLIRYVTSFHQRWNDSGSGARMDTSFWHPNAPEGYHPLGSVIRGNHGNPSGSVPTIVVRDSLGSGTLAAPTGYVRVWHDAGSGADDDGSVWRALCPEGFVALGVVVNWGHEAPSVDDIRCVRKSFTAPGGIGAFITDDGGSGADENLGVWAIANPVVLAGNDGRLPFPMNLALACPGHGTQSCSGELSSLNVLMLPIPVTELADNHELEPRLTGYQPLDVSIPRYFSSMRMPFTLLPAVANSNVEHNVSTSPFYSVYRTEGYTTLPDGVIDNRQGSNPVRKLFSVTTGFEETQTTTFSHEVGITVSAKGKAGFLGNGGEWSVELNYQFGWEQSNSATYSSSSTTETEFTVPAGAYAQVVQVETRFIAVDASGTAHVAELGGRSSVVKYLEYKP